jgi:hypothetical protein
MDEADDTFRLASGVFYEPAKLTSAITDLHANGFTRRNMCVAGTRDALELVMQRAGSTLPALATLDYRRVWPLYSQVDDVEVVATNGALLRKLLEKSARSYGDPASTSSWLLPDLFTRYSDHMRRNAVVLLVNAADSAQQHSSSRILLRHSAHPVQTHEFTPQRQPEGGRD